MSDPLAGLDIRSRYMAAGRVVTRQMVRDVAEAIRQAGKGGVRASEIGDYVGTLWHGSGYDAPIVYGTDRRIDCALKLLKKRGAIRQGTYPRWVWKRGQP